MWRCLSKQTAASYLWGQYQQHELERPHDAPVLLLGLGEGVEHVEEDVAVPREVVVQRSASLQLLELVGIIVHPVPDRLLEGRHEGEVGVLLQISANWKASIRTSLSEMSINHSCTT